MFGWFKRKVIVQNISPRSPLTAIDIIESELVRLHIADGDYSDTPDWLIAQMSRLQDALIGMAQVETHNKLNRIISGNDN